jgi:hypothetical protein
MAFRQGGLHNIDEWSFLLLLSCTGIWHGFYDVFALILTGLASLFV